MDSENSDTPGNPPKSARDAFRSLPAGARRGAGALAVLLLVLSVLFAGSYFLDEPLRRSTEARMNRSLKGYVVRIPKLHVQLVGLTTTVEGMSVFQQENPDPPVAIFPFLRSRIHWTAILNGKLVAEFLLDRPEVRIDLRQIRAEAASPVPVSERGWQQAVEAIYPFKINVLRIRDGTLTYIDQDPDRPLRLTRLNLTASNIRNVRLPENTYPSSFRMETAIFGSGGGTVEGNANFLAEPHFGIDARLTLEEIPLDTLRPVVARANLFIRNGTFSGSGRIEYAPNVKTAHLDHLSVRGMELDYIHTAETAAAEKRRALEVGKAIQEAPRAEMLVRVDRVSARRCTVGMRNENANPPYRVFLAEADLALSNLSNRFSQGPAEMTLRGKFMGSGPASVEANFRPEKNGPDLDLRVRIEDTLLTDMNDLFRAYGRFDVSGGRFALVSELTIRDDAISGYVKPFFREMKVYDRRDDREKKEFRKLYELLVGGIARLLESRSRNEVAAKADISGTVGSPRISSWQILGTLIQNAFFRAILPEFERRASESTRE